jgi:NAD(P) transhydrogenase subunit alpha
MRLGVPKETVAGERRVALVPDVVRKLSAKGLTVVVEPGAGAGALLPDALYAQAGAELGDPWGPTWWRRSRRRRWRRWRGWEATRCSSGSWRRCRAVRRPRRSARWPGKGLTAFAMEAIPRISRAQAMDALSSQSNVAGYKAALLGAEHATRFYPMLMTAAGTIPPAKVLVLGIGVAGLQALATARRLGAQTFGYDVRPETAEQVESLGAKWLDLGIEAAGEGGYARQLTTTSAAASRRR